MLQSTRPRFRRDRHFYLQSLEPRQLFSTLSTVLKNPDAANGWTTGNLSGNTIDLTDLSDVLNNFDNGNTGTPFSQISDFSFKILPDTTYTFAPNDFTQHISDVAPSTIFLQSLPSDGTLNSNGTPVTAPESIDVTSLGGLTYTPNPGYSGSDSFHWSVASSFNVAAVHITVGDNAPVANDSTLIAPTRGTDFASLLLSMFHATSDPDPGDIINSYTIATLPTHGTLSLRGTPISAGRTLTLTDLGNLQYIPTTGFLGTDAFQWTASDGLLSSAPAALTLDVQQEPTVTDFPKSEVTNYNGSFTVADFNAHYSAASGAPLQSITIAKLPQFGTLTVNGAAVQVGQIIPAASIPALVYAPPTGGIDSFQFTASDGTLSSNTATVSLTTSQRPGLVSAFASVRTNGTLSLLLPNGTTSPLVVAAIASVDIALSIRSVEIISLPSYGKLLLGGNVLHPGQSLSPAQFAALKYSATSPGVDSFTFNVSDGFNTAPQNGVITLGTPNVHAFYVTSGNVRVLSNQPPTADNFTDFGTWSTTALPSVQPDVRTFTLTNTSNRTISLANLTFSGANPKDFAVYQLAPLPTVAPGENFSLSIQFSPKATGNRAATLTLPGPSGTKPFVLTLAGTGIVTRTVHTDAAVPGGIVQIATTRPGHGSGATNGQIVSIAYTGYLSTGTVFASSASSPATAKSGLSLRLDNAYAAGQPFINKDTSRDVNPTDFSVIPGWEYGLQGIKVGEKRTIILNAAAGFGIVAPGPAPANATLRFDVECLGIQTKPQLSVFSLNDGLCPCHCRPNGCCRRFAYVAHSRC